MLPVLSARCPDKKTATRGPPDNIDEGDLFAALFSLANPALAIVPSHHPHEAAGKQ
jgi:hypothetical protein